MTESEDLFESQEGQEETALMVLCASIYPIMGAVIARRWPKWGYRFVKVSAVMNAVIAVSMFREVSTDD